MQHIRMMLERCAAAVAVAAASCMYLRRSRQREGKNNRVDVAQRAKDKSG